MSDTETHFNVGDTVIVSKLGCTGIIKYVGCSPYAYIDYWTIGPSKRSISKHIKRNVTIYGIELNENKGNSDGMFYKERYFQCKSNFGYFALKHEIEIQPKTPNNFKPKSEQSKPKTLVCQSNNKNEALQELFRICVAVLCEYIHTSIDLYNLIKSGLLGIDEEWKCILPLKYRFNLYTNANDLTLRLNLFYQKTGINPQESEHNHTFNIWEIKLDSNDNKLNINDIFLDILTKEKAKCDTKSDNILQAKLDSIDLKLCPNLSLQTTDKSCVISTLGYIILYYLSPWQSYFHENKIKFGDDSANNKIENPTQIDIKLSKSKSKSISDDETASDTPVDESFIDYPVKNYDALNHHPFSTNSLDTKKWEFTLNVTDIINFWCKLCVKKYIGNETPSRSYIINRKEDINDFKIVTNVNYNEGSVEFTVTEINLMGFECEETKNESKENKNVWERFYRVDTERNINKDVKDMLMLPGFIDVRKWYHIIVKSHRWCDCTTEHHNYSLCVGQIMDEKTDSLRFIVYKDKYNIHEGSCYPSWCDCWTNVDKWNVWP
eukprot:116154_1